ncbi:hypothetical protein [Mycobacterium sherrisii]|uniref:hypothetical protein n=1 Tax=Mycobacterium sherrisii TaxID=243061 RepID=UPI0012F4A093|nr:hypothetical protein [Mycobacterium sherrisii]
MTDYEGVDVSILTAENVDSWRDLAEQLTATQFAELEACAHCGERLYRLQGSTITISATEHPGARWADTGLLWNGAELLRKARGYARINLIASLVGEVPAPDGARVGNWEDGEAPFRFISAPEREIAGTTVRVLAGAYQFADGSLDLGGKIGVPTVAIDGDADRLSVQQARELAAALIEAADEVEGWSR